MKKLHATVFYALVAPTMALGAGALMAQQSTTKPMQSDNKAMHSNQTDAQREMERQTMQSKPGMHKRDYLHAVPANGMQASNLIGAEVKTINDEDLGSVQDLIIDSNGQVVAIVVSVGGFLGMGDKDVAIGWGNVKTSGEPDDRELRLDVTRENLNAAPKFVKRD